MKELKFTWWRTEHFFIGYNFNGCLMERRDLLKKLAELGYTLVRHGSNHDWYTNPQYPNITSCTTA